MIDKQERRAAAHAPLAFSDSWESTMLDEASTKGDKWINSAATLPDPTPSIHHVFTDCRFDCGEHTNSPCPEHRANSNVPPPVPNIYSRSYNGHPPLVLWGNVHSCIIVESI